MALKRLDREIMQIFPNKMTELLFSYKLCNFAFASSDYIAEFIIESAKNPVLYINIPFNYPFKPPTVWIPHKIMNKRYDRWSADLTNKIVKTSNKMPSYNIFIAWVFSIIKNPEFAESWKSVPFKLPILCMCCESITCSGNWNPRHTISQILIEYLARKNFAVYCSSLGQKRILSIFNNDRWYIPDDLIFCILQHMNIPNYLKIY